MAKEIDLEIPPFLKRKYIPGRPSRMSEIPSEPDRKDEMVFAN